MSQFQIRTISGQLIRFNTYELEAPLTSKAFLASLPFARSFYQARMSGKEIWIDNGPELDIIQENASVFTLPGEIVIGPLKPSRVRTSKCLGIYYGEGKGLDACNIFGRVFDEDFQLLQTVGESIWKEGEQELFFELI